MEKFPWMEGFYTLKSCNAAIITVTANKAVVESIHIVGKDLPLDLNLKRKSVWKSGKFELAHPEAVSYTHLTLPTIYSV